MIEYKVNKVLIVCKLLYPCSSYFGLNDKGNLMTLLINIPTFVLILLHELFNNNYTHQFCVLMACMCMYISSFFRAFSDLIGYCAVDCDVIRHHFIQNGNSLRTCVNFALCGPGTVVASIMGITASTSLSQLKDNTAAKLFVGPTAISKDDVFWESFLAFTFEPPEQPYVYF